MAVMVSTARNEVQPLTEQGDQPVEGEKGERQ